MKILHTLICCFFLSLQDGNIHLVNAQIFTKMKGEDITVICTFSSSGTRKFFCKEPCKEENILIKTTDASAQSGRYRLKYVKESRSRALHVTVTLLTKSDTGQYRCGLDTASVQFGITVVDAVLDGNRPSSKQTALYTRAGENLTVACDCTRTGRTKTFCKDQCAEEDILAQTNGDTDQRDRYSIRYVRTSSTETCVYVTITQLRDSDSGLYRCGLDNSYNGFKIIVTEAPATPPTPTQSFTSLGSSRPLPALPEVTDQSEEGTKDNKLLYIGLAVVLTVLLSSVVLLTFCRKRWSKSKEPSVEREHASNPETNQVYEEIREENKQSRAPPVEISSVHTHIKYSKPNGDEDKDVYNFVTAASSQHKDEGEISKLIYSELNFSDSTVTSWNGAPRGEDSDVVYSVPRVEVSSDG